MMRDIIRPMDLLRFHATATEYTDEQTHVYHDQSECPEGKKSGLGTESTGLEVAPAAKGANGSTSLRAPSVSWPNGLRLSRPPG